MKNWCVPKIWEGGDVWIIGGGHSITEQFEIPSDVVSDVMNGRKSISEYSKYMKAIHGKHTIGVNVAYMLGDWIDIVFFGDSAFFLKHKQRLINHIGLKVSSSTGIQKFSWVHYVQQNPKKTTGISTIPTTVAWNGNSGAAAISIAVNAGAKRIFLLGFDMRLDKNKNQHWHGIYRGNKINESTVKKHLPFAKHLKGFPAIEQDAKRLGVEIINVSPDSEITVFKKMTLKEALTL